MVGEVVMASERLYAAGLSRNAVQALAPIAEGCRDESRMGTCPHVRIAGWLDRSVKTAERAVQELLDSGVLVLVQRGGGRGKALNRYYLLPLEAWEPAGTPDIEVSGVAARQQPLVAAVRDENSGHSDVGSSEGESVGTPDTQLSGVARHAGANSGQNEAELPTTMNVCSPVVPVRTPGGTTQVTADRASVPATEPPPRASSAKGSAPAGSRCGLAGCRAPGPCGACADARRAEQARAVERARLVSLTARGAARARAEAIAVCSLCDVEGYVGRVVCDHDPDRTERARRGRALVEAQLRRGSRADVERAHQDLLAELDAVQTDPDDDPARVPRAAVEVTACRAQPPDQQEEVA